MRRRSLIAASLLATPMLGIAMTETAAAADPENTLYMDLKDGRVVIELLPDIAPLHVERAKILARQGFYDNTVFHRVIEGFMAQGGDPTGTGTGGSSMPNLKDEYNAAHFLRGTVGAASTSAPNSSNSQFFICFAPAPFLDGKYTVWARVVSGMEHVDKIKRGAAGSGAVAAPADRIIKMQVASDAK